MTRGAPQQHIDGFGAAIAQQSPALSVLSTSAYLNLVREVFDATTGAGLSIVRAQISCWTDGLEQTMYLGKDQNNANVYAFDRDQLQAQFLRDASSYGAQILASAWSAPAPMKENQSCQGSNSTGIDQTDAVSPSSYADYAQYLATYATDYARYNHITISAISPMNEPQITPPYPSMLWSAAQINTFVTQYLMPAFQAKGVTAKLVLPEEGTWDDQLLNTLFATAAGRAAVNIVAAHPYFGDPTGPLPNAAQYGKTSWATEFSPSFMDGTGYPDGSGPTGINATTAMTSALELARTIHNTMTKGDASAFLAWWITRCYRETATDTCAPDSSVDVGSPDTQALSLIDGTPTHTIYVTKRLWALGQYARFVRPGAVRINTNLPADAALHTLLSAYRNADGTVALVAINDGPAAQPLSLTLTGISATSAQPYQTSAGSCIAPLPAIGIPQNGPFTATLAAQSITTFVLQTGQSTPLSAASCAPITAIPQSESFSVQPGWNLLSLAAASTMPVTAVQVLGAILQAGNGKAHLDAIFQLINNQWQQLVIDHDGTITGHDYPLQPGKGYLVYSDYPATATIDPISGVVLAQAAPKTPGGAGRTGLPALPAPPH